MKNRSWGGSDYNGHLAFYIGKQKEGKNQIVRTVLSGDCFYSGRHPGTNEVICHGYRGDFVLFSSLIENKIEEEIKSKLKEAFKSWDIKLWRDDINEKNKI